jgi:hypothetical protein
MVMENVDLLYTYAHLDDGGGAVAVEVSEAFWQELVSGEQRSGCIVPRSIWHRQIVHEPRDLLAITFGKGTRYRPLA